ncbi:MAG: AmmeMemoRadiSam system protein B [Candidatus Odinarchaeia archaeon]
MNIRQPVAIGFYPGDKDKLTKTISSCFLDKTFGPGALPKLNMEGKREIIGGISPHAGYIYSGSIAANLYHSLAEDGSPDVFIILGPSHRGYPGVALMKDSAWLTPLGEVETDNDLGEILLNHALTSEGKLIVSDDWPHITEHSLEVQIPFLQYVYGDDFKILPIVCGGLNLATCKKLGEIIAESIKESGKDACIIASTDMTHYGSMFYGFAPVGDSPIDKVIKWVYETDGRIIKAIENLDSNGVFSEAKKTTMCGYIPVTILIEAGIRMGASKVKVLKYATSYDTQGSRDAIVGYLSATVI